MNLEQIALLRSWAADCQKEDAFKTISKLGIVRDNKMEANCCLGRFCRLMGLEDVRNLSSPFCVYGDQSSWLPSSMQKILNINSSGSLTDVGQKVAQDFIEKEFRSIKESLHYYKSLTTMNDGVFCQDEKLGRIGQVLAHLADKEEEGVSCFIGN